MPYPSVDDDGSTVVLDLHGASVRHGAELTDRAIRLSHQRGRGTLKVIHGSSTSDISTDSRTIKNELHKMLDSGRYADVIGSVFKADAYVIVGLVSQGKSSTRITIFDID